MVNSWLSCIITHSANKVGGEMPRRKLKDHILRHMFPIIYVDDETLQRAKHIKAVHDANVHANMLAAKGQIRIVQSTHIEKKSIKDLLRGDAGLLDLDRNLAMGTTKIDNLHGHEGKDILLWRWEFDESKPTRAELRALGILYPLLWKREPRRPVIVWTVPNDIEGNFFTRMFEVLTRTPVHIDKTVLAEIAVPVYSERTNDWRENMPIMLDFAELMPMMDGLAAFVTPRGTVVVDTDDDGWPDTILPSDDNGYGVVLDEPVVLEYR